MNIDPSVRALLLSIMRSFPNSARSMLCRARSQRSVAFSTTEMLGEFARDTQRAASSGDIELASKHLAFMEEWLRKADDIQCEYIDVYYVEDLLYELKDETAGKLWELVPEGLRALYINMWGTPRHAKK